MTGTEQLTALTRALSTVRSPLVGSEYDLHAMIAAALRGGGFVVEHEARLGPGCRVDFLVGRVAVEVKRGRPPRARLMQQCRRYLEQDAVDALILVVEKTANLPDTLCGKPLITFYLNRLWGVALP